MEYVYLAQIGLRWIGLHSGPVFHGFSGVRVSLSTQASEQLY